MINAFLLEELLCIYPYTKFEVVSRGNGMDVPFAMAVDDFHHLQGGELVLLTLDALRGSIEETIEKIEKDGGAAVLINGREDHKSLLYKLTQREYSIPILFYYADLSLDNIKNTLQLISHLKNVNQLSVLMENSTYHIIKEVNKIGMEDFLSGLEARLGKKIMITDLYFKEFFRSLERGSIPQDITAAVKNRFFKEKMKTEPAEFLPVCGEKSAIGYSVMPLYLHHSHIGYVLIEGSEVSAFARFQFQAIIPVLMAEMKKQFEFLQNEKKYQKNFIYDLLHNNFESQYLIINQAQNWGWDLTVPHLLFLMEIKSDSESFTVPEKADHVEKLVKNTLSALFYPSITVELDGVFIILISFEKQIQKKDIKREAKGMAEIIAKKVRENNGDSKVLLGIGRFYPTIINVCRSYQEAKMALEFGKAMGGSSISHFEDLGIVRLLANVRHELLEEFSSEYIGELLEHDNENDADLLETLQVYLAENGNLKSAADKLFIHINTLRNRIKKIETILHIDLQNFEDLLHLIISLKIKNMNEQ
nr:helix-turn-helix domain-containing protein [uncultured Bacillus sp.]